MILQGKTALITGGSSGIGLAVAQLFIQQGARVALMARDEERGLAALDQLQVDGRRAIFIAGDVGRAADCQKAVAASLAAFGSLQILFNNAGHVYVNRTVPQTSEEEWDSILNANLKGVFLMSKYVIPPMAATGGGAIVNNASIFGLVAGSGVAAYCAAKGAVVMLTKAMAVDHAPQNIRVNCVCPGSVDTPLLRNEMNDLGGIELQMPHFAARHPLNRIATPEEIAEAVLYLASPAASFTTGIALPVDGGRSAW